MVPGVELQGGVSGRVWRIGEILSHPIWRPYDNPSYFIRKHGHVLLYLFCHARLASVSRPQSRLYWISGYVSPFWVGQAFEAVIVCTFPVIVVER